MKIRVSYLILALLCLVAPIESRTARKKQPTTEVVAQSPVTVDSTTTVQEAPAPEISVESQAVTEEAAPKEIPDTDTHADQQPDQKPATASQRLLALYASKVISSGNFTENMASLIIENLVINADEYEKQGKRIEPRSLNIQWKNLVSMLERHFRMIVPAYNSIDSFICGLIFSCINDHKDDQAVQERQVDFIRTFGAIGEQLKNFRISKIDQSLEQKIPEQIKAVQRACKAFVSSAQEHPKLTAMANEINWVLGESYLKTLVILSALLNNEKVKKLVPAPEGATKRARRVGKKITSTLSAIATRLIQNELRDLSYGFGEAIYQNAKQYIKMDGKLSVEKIVKTSAQKSSQGVWQKILNQYESIKNGIASTGAWIGKSVGWVAIQPGKGLKKVGERIGQETEIATRDYIKLISRLTSLSKQSIENSLKKGTTIASTIFIKAPLAVARWTGAAFITQFIAEFAWDETTYFVDQRLRSFLRTAPYMGVLLLYQQTLQLYKNLSGKDQERKVAQFIQETRETFELKINTLANSCQFIETYVNNIFGKLYALHGYGTGVIERASKVLQALQIEVFRHRRLIVSEFKNRISLTNQYLSLLHINFIQQDRSQLDRLYQRLFEASEQAAELEDQLKDARSDEEKNMLAAIAFEKYKFSMQNLLPQNLLSLSNTVLKQAFFENSELLSPTAQDLIRTLEECPICNSKNIRKLLNDSNSLFNQKFNMLMDLVNFKLPENATEAQKKIHEKAKLMQKAREAGMLLRGELTEQDLYIMERNLINHLNTIKNELASFGARTYYQMMQSILQTNIDQDYASKLEGHLKDLQSAITKLKADAEHTMPVRFFETYKNNRYVIAHPEEGIEGEPITIQKPLVAPSAAITVEDILTRYYIKPLQKIVENTRKNSPLWSLLPKGQTRFIAWPRRAIKIGTRSITGIFKPVLYDMSISKLLRLGTAISTLGTSEAALYAAKTIVQEGAGSLLSTAQSFIGNWSPTTEGVKEGLVNVATSEGVSIVQDALWAEGGISWEGITSAIGRKLEQTKRKAIKQFEHIATPIRQITRD